MGPFAEGKAPLFVTHGGPGFSHHYLLTLTDPADDRPVIHYDQLDSGWWGDAGDPGVLEIYDPAAGTWTRGPDLPTARSGSRASGLKGRIHVVGGEALSLARTFGEHEAYARAAEPGARSPICPRRTMVWRRPRRTGNGM